MTPARPLAAAATALAVGAAGCGFGAGESSEGEATIRVTRDYGSELMADAHVNDPTESDTVIRALDREAEITTRYGGGFVQSIEGVAGGVEDGRSFDWFFYVNGIESSIGSAEVQLRGGDRIWWDHRDWTEAMRVPAVVGSWPEPLAQAAEGTDRLPVRVECAASRSACDETVERLADDGVAAAIEPVSESAGPDGEEAMRVLVGSWPRLRDDPAASRLERDPEQSGVFARFERSGTDWELDVLTAAAEEAAQLGNGAGLVAAVRDGEDPPIVLVTGTDAAGVDGAVDLLSEETLRDRYAVATGPAGEMPAPMVEGEQP